MVDSFGVNTFSFGVEISEVIFSSIGSTFWSGLHIERATSVFVALTCKKNRVARCCPILFWYPASSLLLKARQNVSSILFSSAILRMFNMAYLIRPSAVFMLTFVASAISLKLMLR